MGDMGDVFRAMTERKKQNKIKRLERADSTGWQVLNTYHWRKPLDGKWINYWPSTGLIMFDGKKTRYGSSKCKQLIEKSDLQAGES